MFPDLLQLANQLIQPLLGDRPRTIGPDIDSMVCTSALPSRPTRKRAGVPGVNPRSGRGNYNSM